MAETRKPYLFEERREVDIRVQYEEASGKKSNPANAIIHCENTGNVGDLIGQRQRMHRIGFDVIHTDDSGIYMESPKNNVKAYEAHCQKQSREGIFRIEDKELAQVKESKIELGPQFKNDQEVSGFLVGGDAT